jgi:Transposase DDE domain/Domain of unknown function (DUF4372)
MRNNITLFGQVLHLIPRYEFEKSVNRHQAEKCSKGFSSWAQFAALLFAQLSRQFSLRSIVGSLKGHSKKLYHLGLQEVKRSTLSYANKKRHNGVFQDLFSLLLERVLRQAPAHSFKFKNPLYSIDSTIIDLCLSMYNWATYRKAKAGIKLHIKLNHAGFIPQAAVVTTAKTDDRMAIDTLQYNAGDVLIFDRGYTDYEKYAILCRKRIYFVTRLKDNARFKVIKRRLLTSKNISSDHEIVFSGFYSKKKCPLRLRKIRSYDPQTKKWIVLLTNQMDWSADTVAKIYKERWQVELFFKTIKTYLKIKSFYGTSRNAVMAQIWVALVAYLLMALLKIFSAKTIWSVGRLLSIIPAVLFEKIDLFEWLNDTFQPPPLPVPLSLQGVLF